MKRLFGVALACLATWGCEDAGVVDATGDIVVAPDSVVYPTAYVGYPIAAGVTVQNTGRAPAGLSASAAAPFALTAPPATLRGGETLTLEVTFAPDAPGPAAGTLVIDAGGHHFEVPLTATALAAPECSNSDPCRVVWFDPEAGSCLNEQADDGTSCSSHCVADGACLEGVCRGAADGCDDGDPCTRDVLATDCTCRHEPVADRPTDDPCRSERCVPGVGWEVTKLPDGTACGTVNVCTGRFCSDGVCGAPAEAPEGTICSAGTPCRKPSRCFRTGFSMECQPPGGHPQTVLAPVWRAGAVGGRQIRYEAVTDDRYLYWAECDEAGCGLRSISPLVHRDDLPGQIDPDPSDFDYEAFDRWDGPMPMFSGEVAREGGLMLSRGLVFSTLRAGSIEAFSAETGEPFFRLDLASRGVPLGRGAAAVNAFGDVVLLLADAAGGPARTVLAVAPAGTVAWEARREGTLRGLVADEDGNVFFGEEAPDGAVLVSLDGSGQERFAVGAPPVAPLAVYDGRLLHGDGQTFATLDGAKVGAPLPLLVPASTLPPVLAPSSSWLAGYPIRDTGPDWTSFSLFRFEPETAVLQWSRPLSADARPWDRSEPMLLDRGSVVLAEGGASVPTRLYELGADGREWWSCALGAGSYGGPVTILSSLWIALDADRGSVAAFLLNVAGQDARRPGAEGWLGGAGEPGRGARPQR